MVPPNAWRSPDGRIYVAQGPTLSGFGRYLGVIQQPGDAGVACSYVDQAFDFGSSHVRFGLPGCVQSYFKGLTPVGTSFPKEPSVLGLPTLFSDVLRVHVPTDEAHSLRVIDGLGRVQKDAIRFRSETTLDATSWPAGVYLMQVFNARGALMHTVKALKE
ncbi:MAG: hypothetical protein KA408_09960 [Flavobacteriales bacterium]|jgi:hypothetical protein|nr:hypothetical protein [Flavobacteriales bacterium]